MASVYNTMTNESNVYYCIILCVNINILMIFYYSDKCNVSTMQWLCVSIIINDCLLLNAMY